jgi:hypothetical protein
MSIDNIDKAIYKEKAKVAYKRCKKMGERNKELEIDILKNSKYSYLYALNVIKGRWMEGEPVIMKDPYYAYSYALDIIQDRWKEAEEYIMKDSVNAFWYAFNVIKDRWPEAIQQAE